MSLHHRGLGHCITNPILWNPLRSGCKSPLERVPGPCRCSKLPKKGYFSPADTSMEIYPVRKKQDPLKRGDRYTSDFIWNSDWKSEMDMQAEKQRKKEEEEKEDQNTSGFLSFSRLTEMNDVSVDMTQKLEDSKAEIERRKEAAAQAAAYVKPEKKTQQLIFPTTRESRNWSRQERFLPQTAMLEEAEGYEPDREALAEYQKEKIQVQLWTLGLIAFCFTVINQYYSQDIAVSYAAGALGGLWYLRLLNQGVDSVGSTDAGGLTAQPRLLIPVILVLGFNRWNELAADKVGITLQLLPLLVGFFTYKAALVGRQSLQVFSGFLDDFKKENNAKL